MEYGSIEREIEIGASPEVVYEVISTPEHLREWWPDEAELDPVPGGTGLLSWGDRSSPDAHIEPIRVVQAEPHRLFSFRWVYEGGDAASDGRSLLVTFELEPRGEGTLLRLTESGFRERGWEAAVLEEKYREHVTGWDHFLPLLSKYAARVASRL